MLSEWNSFICRELTVYRNLLHFYTLTKKLSERKIKKTIPFTIATKRIKFLGISPTEGVKDLYLENYKALIKETEENKTNGNINRPQGLEE